MRVGSQSHMALSTWNLLKGISAEFSWESTRAVCGHSRLIFVDLRIKKVDFPFISNTSNISQHSNPIYGVENMS